MTREEAIERFENVKANALVQKASGVSVYWQNEIDGTVEAIDMAIEALSKPNYETDTEVRLAVTNRKKEKVILWDAFGEVEYYPIEALSAEPKGDLISRADAIDAVAEEWLSEASAESPYVNDDDIDRYRELAEELFADIPSADAISREEYEDIIKDYRKQYENMNNEIADLEAKLSADTVPIEKYHELQHQFVMLGATFADLTEVVRCKDCRWFKQDSSPVGYGYCDGRMVGREVDYNDYCSGGELADKTKYPATYNTNTKCGGCVHLDELGRCLNFMLAKDDRSCWRGSWENNNGELAEQTERREP